MAEPTTVKRAGRGAWRRRLAWAAGGAAALLILAGATADWWLPAAAGRWAGAEFAARETDFGDAVTWREPSWSRGGVAFTAESVRLDAPSRIVLRGGRADAEIAGWTLAITDDAAGGARAEEAAGAAAGGVSGWPELVDLLGEAGRRLERWVGEVKMTDGLLRVAGEEIEVMRFDVAGSALRGEARWRGEAVEFELGLTSGAGRVRWPRGDVEAGLTLIGRTRAKADVFWARNVARGTAEFAPGAWLPVDFGLEGEGWRVAAERLGLAKQYAELRGGFVARRAGEGVSLAVDATASPSAEGFPEAKITLGAEIRRDAWRLERFVIEAPQLSARLSAPLEWRPGAGWSTVGEPVFEWSAELGHLTDGRVTGRAEGSARWSGGAEWRIVWGARGEGLGWEAVQGVAATLNGETTAAATRVLDVELIGADGARVEGSGRYLHAERRIEEGVAKADLPGAALAPWLPEGLTVGRVTMEGTVAGDVSDPQVDGTLAVAGVEHAGWAAERVEATVAGRRTTELRVTAGAERAGARVDAEFVIATGRVEARVLTLRRGDGRELALARPAEFRWAEGRREARAEWTGADERLAVKWDEGGAASVLIRNLDTSWPADWRTGEGWPVVTVRALEVEGRPDADGWIEGAGNFDLAWARAGEPAGWARGEGGMGAAGLRLGRLEIGQAEEMLASGAGNIPWRVKAGARELSPVEGEPWSLRLESRPEATLWDELAKLARVTLERPAMTVALSGEATKPSGRLELSAARIGLSGEGLPDGGLELRSLQMVAGVSRGDLKIERLTAEVDGQRIEAEGRLAMAAGDWEKLRARPYVWLRDHAEGRVGLPEAQVAALARYLPTVLAPTGTLAAELRLTPGANLDGTLSLREGATRPLGGFGVLQGIEVELSLAGRDVRIVRMQATAGGQAVVIAGGARRIPGRMPALDLTVKAERFPLVRRTGLLLRGDLDLTVKTEGASEGSAGRTRVGGEVRLRDSLFLADIRPLISAGGGGGGAAVRARPPYFSVETRPLAEWGLALRVGGDRFLRMRTPVFEGTGSARFDLTGTLREPRAVGEFWVEEGNILFPFASFAVQEGAVRLRAGDPYTPTLDFRATGRRLGYDLRLELGGTAEAPQLQLFSSPPLEAENLLLMVTAGAAPVQGQGQGQSSASQRLAAVGAYVGRDLLRTLGLGGADEERLTLSSGEKVSRQGRETYGFEFRLDQRWSLAGEYDEFDAYNVGLRRRLRAPAAEPEARARAADTAEGAKEATAKKEAGDAR